MPAYYNVPGVYHVEEDNSQYTSAARTVGAAIITPTAKGPAFRPTYVSSYDEYETLFGAAIKSGSDYFEYMGSLLARDYFASGGETLLVVPIRSGSYAAASGSIVTQQGATLVSGSYVGSACFDLQLLTHGASMNNNGGEIAGGNGALIQGSRDNLRWEIANVNNTAGTFSLYIRQGNDTNKRKVILEQWNNLSLDPQSPDYIQARIGDMSASPSDGRLIWNGSYVNRSQYVRVTNVTAKTADSFDINGYFKTNFSGSLPQASSGSFAGGSDGTVNHPMRFFDQISSANSQGFTPSTDAYDIALSLLANKDNYQFNLLLLPGLTATTHPSIVTKAVALVGDRKDAMLLMDPVPYGATIGDVVGAVSGFDTNFVAAYFPHVRIRSTVLGRDVWATPTTIAAGVYAYTDSVAKPWFAPAGENRAKLDRVQTTERPFDRTQLGQLLDGRVNPIKMSDSGVYIWGQKTLQQKSSALDRVNVRRLMIGIETTLEKICRPFVFEPNNAQNRMLLSNRINPFLTSVREQQGIEWYTLIIDETNNTPEIVDRNMMVVRVKIKPTKVAEVIELTYDLTDQGEAEDSF